jgi:hypothetical protein
MTCFVMIVSPCAVHWTELDSALLFTCSVSKISHGFRQFWFEWLDIKNLKVKFFFRCTPWKHARGWRITPLILKLGARWQWVVIFTSLPRYSGEITPNYSWNWKMDRNLSRSSRFCRTENSLALTETELWFLGHLAYFLVTIVLRYRCSLFGWLWIMKWKEYGRKRSWYNLGSYYSGCCLEGLR